MEQKVTVSSPTNENTSTLLGAFKVYKKNRVCLCIRREVKLFTCVVTLFLLPRNAKGEQRANLH